MYEAHPAHPSIPPPLFPPRLFWAPSKCFGGPSKPCGGTLSCLGGPISSPHLSDGQMFRQKFSSVQDIIRFGATALHWNLIHLSGLQGVSITITGPGASFVNFKRLIWAFIRSSIWRYSPKRSNQEKQSQKRTVVSGSWFPARFLAC